MRRVGAPDSNRSRLGAVELTVTELEERLDEFQHETHRENESSSVRIGALSHRITALEDANLETRLAVLEQRELDRLLETAENEERVTALEHTVARMVEQVGSLSRLVEPLQRMLQSLDLQVHTLRMQTAALGAPVPPAGPPPATPLVPRPRARGTVRTELPPPATPNRPASSRVDAEDL